MADENDDLLIEVTGTSNKATSALDKVINKISEFQARIEAATPALTAFTKKMDSLAESSKAVSSLKKLTETANNQSIASKKAEANMAMYQARLDRSNLSMAKAKAQADKLSQSLQKVAESAKIDTANATAFAMPAVAFKQKYSKQAADVNFTPETPEDTYVPTPPAGTSKTASEILNSRVPKTSSMGVNIDTSVVQANLAKIEEFINSLNPAISNMSGEAQAEFEALAGQLRNVSMQIENQFGLYNKLSQSAASAAESAGVESTEYLKLEKQMLSADSAIGKLTSKQNSIKTEMSKIASATDNASSSMRRFGNTSENATRKASNGLHKFNMRMFTMFTRIAAFKIYSAIAQGLQTGIQNIAQASSRANNAMSALATSSLYLKNSIASALMPVIEALTPAITNLVNHLASLFNMIGMFFARLFGGATTVTVAKTANVNYAASLGKAGTAANKVKKNTEGATKAVKELQRTVLGFDELNKLSKETSGSNSGAGTGGSTGTGGGYSAPAPGEMFTTKKIPQDILKMADKVKKISDEIVKFVQRNVDSIRRILSGAALVIGAVLLFTGANIPLGLGLMAVGAVGMAKQVKADWDYLTNKTNTALGKLKRILAIVGAVEIVVGMILAFTGHIGLGLGLIIGGITTTAATLKWDELTNKCKGKMDELKNIFKLAGVIEFIFGAILALTGHIGIGIALMIGGITTTAAAVDWNSITTPILNTITMLMSALGGGLLAIGAILTFSGANMPLGIGLMAAGALALGSAIALDWNSGKANVSTALNDIAGAVSGAFLAIGALLALTGVNMPLGIGLIAVGAIGLVTEAVLNWGSMDNQLRGTLTTITTTVSGFLLALGIILTLTGVAAPLGIAMIAAGGIGLATAVALNWNSITTQVQQTLNSISKTASGWWDAFKRDLSTAGDDISDWWKNKIAPWFTKEKWQGLATQAINSITAPFKNIKWPKISTPHISWKSGGWQSSGWIEKTLSALHLPTQMPKLQVDWYAKGGIFDTPTIAGIGEAGPEAVLPLNDKAFSQIADGIVKNGNDSSSSVDTERIIQRMDKLEKAFTNMKIILQADDRKIAESANRGNKSINRRYNPIASS